MGADPGLSHYGSGGDEWDCRDRRCITGLSGCCTNVAIKWLLRGMTEDAVEARLHDLALEEEALRWWRCLHNPLTWSFVALVLLHIGGAVFFGGL